MFADFGLNERLLKALERLALQTPTPVQQEMIPLALTGRDIQASAETGSGKTAAYLLPILQRLLDKPEPLTATRALILLPTRELSQQVEKHCRDLAGFTQMSSGVIVGGTSYTEQKALIRKNPEFIIGTPGRILEHVQKGTLELKDLEFLVLDEADRMLDMGFREEVMTIVRACSPQRQTFLLSATLVHDGIGRIAGEVLKDPGIVAIGTHREEHTNISQQVILADDPAHKKQLANWLLANTPFDKALVFTNTREHAQQLADFLQSQRDRQQKPGNVWHNAGKGKMKVACLHGEMPQDERKKIMHWFREGVVKILVSTDLAARGLDVKGVDLVINFGVARSGDDHVHRSGRTGRAGEKGLVITLVAPQEWNVMSSIERYLGIAFEPRTVEGMEARFKGPVKKTVKKSDKKDTKPKKKLVPKAEQRHSFKKNIGKRRKPSGTGDMTQENIQDKKQENIQDKKPAKARARKPAKEGALAQAAPSAETQGMVPLKRKKSRPEPE